jgi:ParB-like chromosome segregation protein Spo0J
MMTTEAGKQTEPRAKSEGKYQVMPPLSAEEWDTLRNSIAANGVIYPILTDETTEIIDGHNRWEIANELGLPYDVAVMEGLSEDEKLGLAVSMNAGSRNLSPEQKRVLIVGLRERGWTQTVIAKHTGIPQPSVSRYLAMPADDDIEDQEAPSVTHVNKTQKRRSGGKPGETSSKASKSQPGRRLARSSDADGDDDTPPHRGGPMTLEESKDQARRMLAQGHPVAFVALTCNLSDTTVRKLVPAEPDDDEEDEGEDADTRAEKVEKEYRKVIHDWAKALHDLNEPYWKRFRDLPATMTIVGRDLDVIDGEFAHFDEMRSRLEEAN